MTDVGHNNPPGQIEFSKETVSALSEWMKDHPVIETEDDAREAKLLLDRGALCSKDMVDERQAKTGPLLKQVEDIRAQYREPQSILDRVVTELQARINAFILREEEKRRAIAEEARRKADEAMRAAREAEEAEKRAKEEAAQGICDVDIADFTANADHSFEEAKQAVKAAQLATRQETVKIGGGFRRAQSLRTKETLVIDNVNEALECMGLTDAIRDTILSEARSYRKTFGELPDGVSSHKERS